MAKGQRDLSKERLWRELVQRWRRSGQTVRDFCAAHGLSEANFYAWRRTIDQRDRQADRLRERTAQRQHHGSRRGSASQAEHSPTFVQVKLGAVEATSPGIEVVVGPGRIVRVPAGFDADTLRQLLAVLEEPAC
jgi:hypothetical protein